MGEMLTRHSKSPAGSCIYYILCILIFEETLQKLHHYCKYEWRKEKATWSYNNIRKSENMLKIILTNLFNIIHIWCRMEIGRKLCNTCKIVSEMFIMCVISRPIIYQLYRSISHAHASEIAVNAS